MLDQAVSLILGSLKELFERIFFFGYIKGNSEPSRKYRIRCCKEKS